MDGISALRMKVTAQRAELDKLRASIAPVVRRIEIMSAEADAYDEALRLFTSGDLGPSPSSHTHVGMSANVIAMVIPGGSDRRRGPKGAWKQILAELYRRYPGEFGLDDVATTGDAMGNPINRNTIRSQLSNYTKTGWIERVREGRYKFSERGIAVSKELSSLSGNASPNTETLAVGSAQAASV